MLIPDKSGKMRRHDGTNVYKVRGKHEYLMVLEASHEPGTRRMKSQAFQGSGGYEYSAYAAYTDVQEKGHVPPMGGCNVSASYLREKCRQVSWAKIPPAWQKQFLYWMSQDDVSA